MRALKLSVLSAAGLLVSMAAFADDAKPAAPVQAMPVSASSATLYCKPIYHEGLLINGRECHTKAEWDRARHETQELIREIQIQSFQGGK